MDRRGKFVQRRAWIGAPGKQCFLCIFLIRRWKELERGRQLIHWQPLSRAEPLAEFSQTA